MGMCALNVAVCAVASWFFVRVDRRTTNAIVAFEERMRSAERTVADAAGVALALADRESPSAVYDGVDTTSETPRPEILGFGQTRSVAAIYPYCDIRSPAGDVRRLYLARVPLPEAKGGEGAPLVGADGVNPP